MKNVLSRAWQVMTTLAVVVALLLMLGIASGPEQRSYQALGDHQITLVHYESCSWWNIQCKHRRFWHNLFSHGQRV